MAKKKNDSGSSGRMATTVALTGGVFLLRKLLATGWTKVTGKAPPTDLSDHHRGDAALLRAPHQDAEVACRSRG
jgi:hypothetical protein